MPRKEPNNVKVPCRYFLWTLRSRDGVWQADGRSNQPSAGRHSLNTRDFDEAKDILHDLDLQIAVNLGLANRRLLDSQSGKMLSIECGLDFFDRHLDRPAVAGGPKDTTKIRYRRIIRAFTAYTQKRQIQYWEQVDADVFHEYAKVRSQSCTSATVVTEISLCKAILSFLIESKHLDPKFGFTYRVRRPKQSTRYCPTPDEMRAILNILAVDPDLKWLHDVVSILSYTGMRFGEVAQMTWDDVNLKNGILYIRDDVEHQQSTKSGCSRKVPIHQVVRAVIEGLSPCGDELLLHGPRGGRLRGDTFGDYLRKCALQPLAELFSHPRFQKITAHSLRHFFNSLCAASGISQQYVMEWMGHRTSAMTKYYFTSDDQASQNYIKKLELPTDVPPARADDIRTKPETKPNVLEGNDPGNQQEHRSSD